MLNLADEKLIPVEMEHAISWTTLPEALALLSADRVEGFEGLMAHQRQPWFLFLVQLAAMALAVDDQSELPAAIDADQWHRRLLALTPGVEGTAWSLLVPDHQQPALLQPPIRDAAAWARMQPLASTPDGVDVLITAKNHDVKQARIGAAQPHHWLFALVSLQTSQGFLGRGNFGIARMNGGFGSRMLLELVPGMSWGTRFRRAVDVALNQRRDLRKHHPDDYAFGPDAHRLLWLLPWDREEALPIPTLDPCFVEVCRRVRLITDADGRCVALGRPSDSTRVEAKERKGLLDDPWIPINLATGGAYTVSGEGFRYDRVADLLFDTTKVKLPAAVHTLTGDPQTMHLHLSVLVRGQGKTEGLHDRVLPLKPAAMRRILREGDRERAHEVARRMVGDAKTTLKAVKTGLLCQIQGAPEKINFEDKRATHMLEALDEAIDGVFFDHLWRILEAEDADPRDADAMDRANLDWWRSLHRLSQRAFERGCQQLPPPSARRERSRVLANALYRGVMNKNMPLPKRDDPDAPEPGESQTEDAA
ncbi:type I-E CRISPR-associated protein Cse1/CasA [Azospirillum griseum]|uniref:Type I-E CRISPR-associated protein Cse1/CasA n=1 Tax=Azospirillum griseum TaxID=2496639 RepID=A0A3S0HYI2_9PROT|nr:type I-E CRISPR-associated protein Cse1/CasA [Azospirillum griseum]RTR17054.1 type I-E CRISPR-associated protein Cse1/CasA [Azospirillum griseum]